MTDMDDEFQKYEAMSASDYLRDLAERLTHVPVMYGTDQYDISRLNDIAHAIEKTEG